MRPLLILAIALAGCGKPELANQYTPSPMPYPPATAIACPTVCTATWAVLVTAQGDGGKDAPLAICDQNGENCKLLSPENAVTHGANSPAIQGGNGDVVIQYGGEGAAKR